MLKRFLGYFISLAIILGVVFSFPALEARAAVKPMISAGYWAPLALKSDGTVWTWNSNIVQIQGIDDIIAISGNNLALRSDGTVWAWGDNSVGQLGIGTIDHEAHPIPVKVQGLDNVVAISSHVTHSLALKANGTVWAWGYNKYGQLGDGTTTDKYTPVQVQGLTNVVAIAAGNGHSLALKSDGTVWGWGWNNYGQLGDGTTTNRSTPVKVQSLNNVVNIAADTCSLAVKSDGTVWSWGSNSAGQLGDGTTINRSTPVQVKGLNNVAAVTVTEHALALKLDGTVWAWGWNGYGQLGDGTNINKNIPVQVYELNNAIAIATGSHNSWALTSDGTIWGWGDNASGQLGDGTTTSKNIPVKVQNLNLTAANLPTINMISVAPTSIALTTGQNQQITVTAIYSDGSSKDVTDNATYQVGDTTIASVTNGMVKGLTPGNTNITVTYGGQTVAIPVTVITPTVTKITVTPNALNMAINENQQLSVTATYTDGSSKNVTNQARYQSGDVNVASVNSTGLALGVNPGSTNITVTFVGQSTIVPVTVNVGSAELVSLTVNPISMYIAKGQTQQLSVTAVYSDGTSKNVTTEASYQSGNTNVAEVYSSGLVTAVDYGSTQITITYGTKSVVIPVTVGQYTVTQPVRSGTQVPPTVSTPTTPPARRSTIPTVTSLRNSISGRASSPSVVYPSARKYLSDGYTVSHPQVRTQNKEILVIYPK